MNNEIITDKTPTTLTTKWKKSTKRHGKKHLAKHMKLQIVLNNVTPPIEASEFRIVNDKNLIVIHDMLPTTAKYFQMKTEFYRVYEAELNAKTQTKFPKYSSFVECETRADNNYEL